MKGYESYRITIKDRGTEQFNVLQRGDITHVMWKNESGRAFMLAYTTLDAIQYLKEGRWIRVSSKKARPSSKRNTLFSFDDLD